MPWPLKDGGAIAMYQLSTGLVNEGCQLSVLVPETNKHEADFFQLPELLRENINFKKTRINSDITVFGALINLFSTWPYYISRYRNRNFNKLLTQTLQEDQYDIIIVESLKMSPYLSLIRNYSQSKVLLRTHNVEFLIWERMKSSVKNPLKKVFLNIMVNRLQKYELKVINDFDGILSITQTDADYFHSRGLTKPCHVVLSGIDFERFKAQNIKVEFNSLFHLGALNWLSNLEAVEWFLNKVWPEIYKRYPFLKFYIAGRNTPEKLLNSQIPGVVISGEVDDAIQFMLARQIMIVPLLSGSGMRIKIAEGLALGKTIISTSVGAEGIGLTHAENVFIADSPENFISVIEMLVENPELVEKTGKNALEFARRNLDNREIIRKMMVFLNNNK